MIIPDAVEVFGRNPDGTPVVNLAGLYSGGMEKSMVFRTCYRTPNKILMAAHAINMGLYRQGGPLQGPTRREDWDRIGYQVDAGDFRKSGQPMEISRVPGHCLHPVDHAGFSHQVALGEALQGKQFESDAAEIAWVADRIREDINRGLAPHDILVTGPRGNHDFGPGNHFLSPFYTALAEQLLLRGVQPHFPTGADDFFVEGRVTLATIFRAKGNEAWKAYVCRFQHAIKPWDLANPETPHEVEMEQRNQAFTALTRAKVWCVITGQTDSPVWQELAAFHQHYPKFRFPAFNQADLRRRYDDHTTAEELLLPIV